MKFSTSHLATPELESIETTGNLTVKEDIIAHINANQGIQQPDEKKDIFESLRKTVGLQGENWLHIEDIYGQISEVGKENVIIKCLIAKK